MWRLWHLLFGWDYAFLTQDRSLFTAIRRVYVAPDGVRYALISPVRVIFADSEGWAFRMLTGRVA